MRDDPRGDQEPPERDGVFVEVADEELVARTLSGDTWAFDELTKRHQQKAYDIAYHLSQGDAEQAKDLTQEAFLKTFKSLKRFRGDSTFYTWFYRIVVNTCLDGRRSSKRREQFISLWPLKKQREDGTGVEMEAIADPGSTASPLDALSGRQLSREILRAVERLPERQRAAFQLKVFHGMSIREIAEVMETAEGTVKSHLFRAIHFLQDALKEWL